MRSVTKVSAGGVVYKKSGKSVNILLIKDPKDNWTFPKGIIEKNEDAETAARREIQEETGLHSLIFKKKLSIIKYFYTYKKNVINKTVHYFLFQFTGKEKPVAQKEEGISKVAFFPLLKALKIIGYQKTNVPIFDKIKKTLAIN